jgi:hypothetical protein
VLDCFMRALPHAYRDVVRPPGTLARFTVTGDCGGDWFLRRDDEGWRQIESAEDAPASETTIPQEIAWLMFTKGMSRAAASARVGVSGDAELGRHVLAMVTIVG